jgi:hypothetical protein
MTRLLLIGEDNPYGSNDFALYHLPRGASGDRLRRIMGVPDHVYEKFDKLNLCEGGWDRVAALKRAAEIYRERWSAYDSLERSSVLLLCGAKVRECFKGPDPLTARADGTMHLISIPHPSGRCREWQDPRTAARVRYLLRIYVPEVEWGQEGCS